MLRKEHISNIQIYSPEWEAIRLGRFTSSQIHVLMAEKGFSEGAMNYIYHKVGERITGQSAADETEIIEDENTVWGHVYEPEALQVFGRFKKIEYLVVQKLIFDPTSNFSSTPDALWVLGSSLMKENEYNVCTVEVKCPKKFHTFLPLYRCKTPHELKKESKKYFWQVVDQMYNCDAAVGYFVVYHPLFPPGKNINVIEFRKIDLWNEFILMKQRKELAVQKFNEVLTEFLPQKA